MDRAVPHDIPQRSLRPLRGRLLRQAHLFDDPRAYRAGVLDALRALLGEHAEHGVGQPSLPGRDSAFPAEGLPA